jgi:hypothetical protein
MWMIANTPAPGPGDRVSIDIPRLWGGGLATALVAAFVAFIGVQIFREVLDVTMASPPLLLAIGSSFTVRYAVTAFFFALLATGLAHVLSLTTPKPQAFFAWIVWLATIAGAVLPFAQSEELGGKVATAVVNLVLGACISSLVAAVLSRTVFDVDRSWQRFGL